ncbi:MAG: radical SAM protein [Alphaproteobacteria bacterium]
MEYVGKIYRPWMEAESFLIQTTIGCSHNTCTFCSMFDDKKFQIRPLEDVLKDIEKARRRYYHIESFFLIDGNVLVIKTQMLLTIIKKIKMLFPECKKIAMYAAYNDIRRKSIEELKELKEAGLSIVYTGLESGDEEILKKVKKNLTPEQAIEGAKKAKEAGIEVLASIIFGLGGKDYSKEHIINTTNLLNIIQPEQLAPMALAIQPCTVLEQQVKSGEFVQASAMQMIEEEKYLIENLNFRTFYWGDHGNNIVSLRGYLPDYKNIFLKKINATIKENPQFSNYSHFTHSW